MNLLDLNYEKAKEFFLESKNYCTLDLPYYIDFQELLEKISQKMGNKTYKEIKNSDPKDYDDINYVLFNNKDGGYDWRPFQIINPVMYISLVNVITKEENWNAIIKRFVEIDKTSAIKCESIPIIEEENKKILNKKSNQILNWWDKIEQNSIKLSLEYEYIFQTDIVNCYSEIYTHSVSWAIHTRGTAKKEKDSKTLIGNIIDKHLREMSYGQTNGIPQGSVLMDFIAEIILKYADELISEEINRVKINKGDFKILRYRDDYKVFVNEIFVGREIMKTITKVLSSLGLKININKTRYSDNIVLSSIKNDKLEFLNQRKENNLQKRLILLYNFSLSHLNSGSVIKELTQIRKKVEKKKDFSKENIEVLISVVTEIIYKNPRAYIEGNAILSYLFPLIKDKDERKGIIIKVFSKLKKILNSKYFEIWFQRATLKEENLNIEYNENICKLVESDIKIMLWNINWISDQKIKKIFEDIKIVDQKIKDSMPQKIADSEIKIFDQYEKIR